MHKQPLVISFTFDDGWLSQYSNALPILNTFRFKGTFYVVTQWLAKKAPLYMPADAIREIHSQGHEIGAHSVTHWSLPFFPWKQKEILQSKKDLENFLGAKITSFAYPYGRYNKTVLKKVQEAGYRTARTTEGRFKRIYTRSPFELPCKSVRRETTIAEVKNWIEEAKSNESWLIINFHQVLKNPYNWGCTPEMFRLICMLVKLSEAIVLPVSKAFEFRK